MGSTIKVALAALVVSVVTACASEQAVQGHEVRLFAVDQPAISWVTENDVKASQRLSTPRGDVLRVQLKPDAARRLLGLTEANLGKTVRFTWDGKTVSEMKVASAFGDNFELPAPPK